MTPLDRIIKALGSVKAVAELCDVSGSAVQQWADNGIPRQHLLALESATKNTSYPVTLREMVEWQPIPRKKVAA